MNLNHENWGEKLQNEFFDFVNLDGKELVKR